MIKERVIKLLEFKGIPKEKFYDKIGVTSANFRGNAKKTPLNSTTIENILSEIPDLNLDWLLTGSGSMIKSEDKSSISQNITGNSNTQSGKNTSIAGNYSEKIEKLEAKLQEYEEKLAEKDRTISQLVNLMSSK